MDHHQFDESVLDKGTKAILKTRDGLLRAAVPSPLGSCVFVNDVSEDELYAALRKHKEIMEGYPRNGEGIEAFVDASDTGYTVNGEKAEITNGHAEGLKEISVLNDDTYPTNGVNGHQTNGTPEPNGIQASEKHASRSEGADGMQNGIDGMSNGLDWKNYGLELSNGVYGMQHDMGGMETKWLR